MTKKYQNNLNVKLFDFKHSNHKCQNDQNDIQHFNDQHQNDLKIKVFDVQNSLDECQNDMNALCQTV